MKYLQRTVLIAFVTALSVSGFQVWAQDSAELQAANQDVQSAQNQLNEARQDYSKTVRTSGKDSPQTAAAKAKLDAAHTTWRGKMDARKHLRQQVRGEMIQRHAARRQHSTAP